MKVQSLNVQISALNFVSIDFIVDKLKFCQFYILTLIYWIWEKKFRVKKSHKTSLVPRLTPNTYCKTLPELLVSGGLFGIWT
jgi:hypothetical protein